MALVKYNNNSISAITTPGTLATGAMVLIKEQTASSSSTISFVDGTSDVVLDNTYPIYLFHFINIHPSGTNKFSFNLSVDSGSNYNVAKTSTVFRAYHQHTGGSAGLGYQTGLDLAQGTGIQNLGEAIGTSADDSLSGYLHLFDPSSTVHVKNFVARISGNNEDNHAQDGFSAGYFNTTSAITAIQFKMSSGDIDSATMKLYGLKDS